MWFSRQPSRLDRIEESIERLAEISIATNLRIDRFIEATDRQLQGHEERIEQLQQSNEQLRRAVEYLLSKDR